MIERVTGREVARTAGVSTAAVSLVLSGKDAGRISPATRDRVLQVAQDLGYRVDGRGRSLATGRTGIIGFVAPDSTTPYFGALQRGLFAALTPEYELLTAVSELGRQADPRSIARLFALGVDGLIVVGIDAETVKASLPNCPVLLLDTGVESDLFPTINLDVTSSAIALGRHLTELGHTTLGYLDADTGAYSMDIRRRALMQSFRTATASSSVPVARCPIDPIAAREAITRLWPTWRSAGVTAIACGSDLHALGVISGLRHLGLHCPADVSVCGADDQPLSTVFHPALTTVQLPVTSLAALAGRYMRTMLESHGALPEHRVLDTRLIVRESTGPRRS